MTMIDFIGLLAGTLTTVAFLPQARKTWRTRSTADFSFTMLTAFCTGIAFWLVYGLMLKSWPLIIANGITFVLAGSILYVKLRGDR